MKKTFLIILAAAILFAAYTFAVRPLIENYRAEKALEEANAAEKYNPVGPVFNADSAFAFTAQQLEFGPRAMNTPGHERCAEWIIAKFKSFGCEVTTQQAQLKGYDGTMLKATNIMAQFRPELTTRILLCAHWDSRPWADNDPDKANWHKPILAANDAASGVAVMLELARLLQQKTVDGKTETLSPNIGIDFVWFDAEDWGTPQWAEDQTGSGDSWALGAQHFARNLPQGYEARYGILLDMVGGQGARFYQEGVSLQFAPAIVKKVWKAARQAGYGSFFPQKTGGMITDDHLPLNQYAHIPTIDIIPYYPDCEQSSFGPTWHTLADDLSHIDRATLKAVGQTMVQVLWNEQ